MQETAHLSQDETAMWLSLPTSFAFKLDHAAMLNEFQRIADHFQMGKTLIWKGEEAKSGKVA